MAPPDFFSLYPHHQALFNKARPFILQAWEDQNLGRVGHKPAFTVGEDGVKVTTREMLLEASLEVGKMHMHSRIDISDPSEFFPVVVIAPPKGGGKDLILVIQMACPGSTQKPVWEA